MKPDRDQLSLPLLDGLAQLGFKPTAVQDIFLTHIHLDHAGAAGWWARQGARVHVHPRGARHLVDPSRLLAGAQAVYGDRMKELWGEILPAPEAYVIPVEDNQSIQVGDIELTAWDTPGHARHHHCWILDEEHIAFTGDAANVRLNRNRHIALASAPPQFDPPAFEATLSRLEKANFLELYPTHFGVVKDVSDHLSRCRQIVCGSTELVLAHLRNGLSPTAVSEHFSAYARERAERDGCPPESWDLYELINPCSMCAEGVQLFCQELLAKERPAPRRTALARTFHAQKRLFALICWK